MNRLTLTSLAAGVLLAALTVSAQADVSNTTPTVKGRAPSASSVTVSNQSKPGSSVELGQTVEAAFTFDDTDGDTESGTTYVWKRGGTAISGATSSTYTTVMADLRKNLAVEVTPKTDTGTTDPAVGTAVSSPTVTVGAVSISPFLAPDTLTRTYSDANSYCQGLGGNLPSRELLQQLFLDQTSATGIGQSNTEMCSKYGWPLIGQCGGGNTYWSSTLYATGSHYGVGLSDGRVSSHYDSGTHQVACVR